MVTDPTYRQTVQSTPSELPLPTPAELAPLFPQLEILDVLGWGGMGVVYKARQPHLDRLVALKLLAPKPGRDQSFNERFAREARALARLQHPGIVTVHDSGQAAVYYYFIMEYVDGVNLRQLMSEGPIEPSTAMAIVPQVCEALQYAHDEGVLHRDIKPENILIDRKGRVKIADFGLAKLSDDRTSSYALTAPQQVLGTMHYMAPEQIERSSEVDHRADLYALGVVMYELLTGELPIGRFPLPSETTPLDARVDEIVMRSLEKQPARRYQKASEIKTDIESVSSSAHAPLLAAANLQAGTAAPAQVAHPFQAGHQSTEYAYRAAPFERQVGLAYLLWVLGFVGACGIHRIYAGRYITGVLWFLTAGLLFIGQLIDLLLIPGMIQRANLMARYEAQFRQPPPYR